MALFYKYMSPRTRLHRFLMGAFLLFLSPIALFSAVLTTAFLVGFAKDLLKLDTLTGFLLITVPLSFFFLGMRLFWILWDGLSWKTWNWLFLYYGAAWTFWGVCAWLLADLLHDELVHDVWKWPRVSLGFLALPLLITVIVRPSRKEIKQIDDFGGDEGASAAV